MVRISEISHPNFFDKTILHARHALMAYHPFVSMKQLVYLLVHRYASHVPHKGMILPTADKSDLTPLWLHSGCKLKRNRAALALNRGVLKLRFSTGAHSTTSVGFGWENLHYCVAHPVFLQGAGHTANNIRVYWLMVTQSWQHCILICFAKNVSRIQTNNPSRHPFFRTIFNIALPDPLMFPMLFRKIVWCQFNHTFVAAVEWVASAGRQPDGRVYFVHLIFFMKTFV